jgi:hypothetical protein
LLGALFVALFSVVSVEFKNLQNTQHYPHLDDKDMTLSDRDKSYVDRYTDLSKWLIAVSYALLVGVATKHMEDRGNPLFRSVPFSLGIGLLLLSLYAGFLSYQSVLIVLSSKPMWMLRSGLTSFPVAAQLWFLLGATALLAFAFFRGDRAVDGTGVPDDKKIPLQAESTVASK